MADSRLLKQSKPLYLVLCLALAGVAFGASVAGAAAKTTNADVRKGLEGLVAAPGGPPGAIATIYKNGKLTTISVGRADLGQARAPRATDHMRIASVTKAFSGAVALHLVGEGKLELSRTLEELLPEAPAAWGKVTVAQMLDHTSGIPDYTKSKAFFKQAETDPQGFVSPREVVGWVAEDPLEFTPGKRYEYSNTDNILVGLIAEKLTGEKYGDLLKTIVFGPAGLSQTSFPTKPNLPNPFIHGYVTAPGEEPQDVSTSISPSGAWASGAIVSTPANLNAFIRADLGLRFFDRAQQAEQMVFFPGGESSPPGPGRNSAGLALFRYQTHCGTVYGHTGDFPGYVQLAVANANGARGLTVSLNISAPSGRLLAQLRHVQTVAVCALLGK